MPESEDSTRPGIQQDLQSFEPLEIDSEPQRDQASGRTDILLEVASSV